MFEHNPTGFEHKAQLRNRTTRGVFVWEPWSFIYRPLWFGTACQVADLQGGGIVVTRGYPFHPHAFVVSDTDSESCYLSDSDACGDPRRWILRGFIWADTSI